MEPRRDFKADLSRYAGFRGHWDKEMGAFVFDSKEERDRFQIEKYGYREEWDEADGRPAIVYKSPPLDLRYLKAVRAAPREQYPNLAPSEYVREIVTLAEGIQAPDVVQSMPKGPRGEW